MELSVHKLKYKDAKSLSTELYFAVACARVEGYELIKLELENSELSQRYVSSASKLLKTMKRDGVIQLFLLETELCEADKMEAVYLINKFPELQGIDAPSDAAFYVKL